jgi:two-component system chemotaxis response regulator CheY
MISEPGAGDVIIADNDYVIRDILRSVLEREGLTVLQAVDGDEAIDYAQRTSATLLILDYKMPRLDGISACAEIRQLPGYASTPIAVLTAFDDDQTRAAAQAAGVTAFLAKPFKAMDLLQAVRELLGTPSPNGDHQSPAFVWPRRLEPRPLLGQPWQLVEGHRILNICRPRKPSD